MFYLHKLQTENQFNKVRRNQRKTGNRATFFIHHAWDQVSQVYLQELQEAYGENIEGEPLYLLDYFDLPTKMSGIFQVKKMPTVVLLSGKPGDNHPNPVEFVDYPQEIDEVLLLNYGSQEDPEEL